MRRPYERRTVTVISPKADDRPTGDDTAVNPGRGTPGSRIAYGSCMDDEPGAGRSVALDAGLAVLVACLGVTEVLVPLSTVTGTGTTGVAVALVLLSCLPLALRRRFPLPVLIVCTLPWGVVGLFTDVLVLFWGGLLPIAIAAYSVARHGRGREPYAGLAVLVVGIAVMGLGNEALQTVGELVFPCLGLVVAWVAGLVIARTHRVANASVRRAAAVEERSREETLLAIAEERGRIARELHDVVAHAVTAMVVQAGAARQVVGEDPDYVRQALNGIRATGSQALEEMRRVVSVLRTEGEDSSLSPQPGLGELPALVAASGTTLTRVQLNVEGSPQPLTAGQGLAAYRIVQEALTNAHRHSRARTVDVSVLYGSGKVRIEVRDDGVGHTTGSHGHGLIGMRERAAAHGGHVEFESGSGFLVRACLPLGAQA